MASFEEHYSEVFATFGYPLTERTALSTTVLAGAERRLGVKIPAALREYYRIAGRERRFNTAHNRLLPPSDWSLDQKRLIFMEENQAVVYWGVSIRNPDSDDPPASQGINNEPITWHPENRKCSGFLTEMLHYQAVCGGFRFCGGVDAPERLSYRFEGHGWRYAGKTGGISAYRRPNQVVCLTPPSDLPFQRNGSILAGGKTRRDLQGIAEELGVSFE